MNKNWSLMSSIVITLISLGPLKAQAEAHSPVPIFDSVNSIDSSYIDPVAQEFKRSAIDYLIKIKGMGTERIQNKTIDALIEEIPSISIVVLDEIKFENDDLLGTSRNCARWNRRLNAIFISRLNWTKLTSSQKQSIAAHEAFGALGIIDNKFEVTSVTDAYLAIENIRERSNPRIQINPRALNSFKSIFKNQFFLRGEGGVTGVGGGGDLRPLGYKSALINAAFASFNFGEIDEQIFFKLIKVYQIINVEFSDAVQQGAFLFDSDTLSIFIPNNAFTDLNSSINMSAAVDLNNRLIIAIKARQK